MDLIQLHRRLEALKRLAAGQDCSLYIGIDPAGFDIKIVDKTTSGAVYSRVLHPHDIQLNEMLNPTVIDLISECKRKRVARAKERDTLPTMTRKTQ